MSDFSIVSQRSSSAPHAPKRSFFFPDVRKKIWIRNNSKYNITVLVTNNPNTMYNKIKHVGWGIGVGGAQIKGDIDLFDNHKDTFFFRSFYKKKSGIIYIDLSTFYIHVLVRLENGDYIIIKKDAYERNYDEYDINDDDIVLDHKGIPTGKYIKTENEINKIQLLGL